MSEAGWHRVPAADGMALGVMLACELDGKLVAVYRLEDGSFHATENVCSHAFALLTEGWLDGAEVECPLHAGRFDVRTGQALCPPVDQAVAVYAVRVEAGEVFVGGN